MEAVSKPEAHDPKIGLALSGGGFRASIFHLGVIRRLEELGLMKKVSVLPRACRVYSLPFPFPVIFWWTGVSVITKVLKRLWMTNVM